MNQHQRTHIATVVESIYGKGGGMRVPEVDPLIRDSWQRCVDSHGLDPFRMQQAQILSAAELHAHREPLDEFRRFAWHGMTQLWQQVAPAGYMVLLTNAQGVTLDYIGDKNAAIRLRRAGLFAGAQWTEASAGTCAVGTALATGLPLTVHQQDHFDATHIPLTCSAVPLFDPDGPLKAVLDISALRSPQPKESQHLTLQIAQMAAWQIEQAWFNHHHHDHWVLKLSLTPSFVDVSPDFLLAFDANGRLTGHNHRAQRMLETEMGFARAELSAISALIGLRFEQIFQQSFDRLPGYLSASGQRPALIALLNSSRALCLSVVAPPQRASATLSSGDSSLPEPLAALNGGDASLQRQLQRAAKLLNSPINLVVQGETGSGKEYFAKAFHRASDRANAPFIAVNCAAIPATLIESELFGAMPGSFSGASSKPKRGLIQEASGGTLFLDEIGDMPLEMQSRLLRVLAEHEVLPVGASRPVAVDIRVICASHYQLEQRVAAGHFRADLYYRLNGAQITLPPLRQRSDLEVVIERMLAGKRELTAAARQRLLQHRWPGNLRELRNVLDYARQMAEQHHIALEDLPDSFQHPGILPAEAESGHSPVSDSEAQRLMQLLAAAQWNRAAVARQMGISRMTLYRHMRRLGIRSPLIGEQ
ncbi:transcriptional regulator of acetoin/glycerol metabolism [Erwinia toletana]|uniref:Transcriptional regulator of acetoin/glycerol metabolism n=1 Tax=Winslowiella toletana TaxID=92490 RepID=A0ABS4PFP8_9GAMM|nr:sigma-54-dependent Fis family transcriptional regulator [Winslowiella toletana]MBP2171470.1 transcriptional regulator of acetoin/glycerol metabolism [Winslowiella toletana]